MCTECGCHEKDGKIIHAHHHDHHHDHDDHRHDHGHDHEHKAKGPHPHSETRTITLERDVLARNHEIAAENRKWLKARGVTTINFISSPGSGKTFLLEKTLERLQGKLKCAVIAGDQQTDNDARRLAGHGAAVRQIETRSACHLNAEQVGRVLPELISAGTRLLFIENVGNLVCPAAFQLGEDFKIALLSTTEGEDKPLKYPALFTVAKTVIITKTDLMPHLDWDLRQCRKCLQQMNPGVFIFELSAKTGAGLEPWIEYLVRLAD